MSNIIKKYDEYLKILEDKSKKYIFKYEMVISYWSDTFITIGNVNKKYKSMEVFPLKINLKKLPDLLNYIEQNKRISNCRFIEIKDIKFKFDPIIDLCTTFTLPTIKKFKLVSINRNFNLNVKREYKKEKLINEIVDARVISLVRKFNKYYLLVNFSYNDDHNSSIMAIRINDNYMIKEFRNKLENKNFDIFIKLKILNIRNKDLEIVKNIFVSYIDKYELCS